MPRFTRINPSDDHPAESRVFGRQVTIGEPVKIQGDAELRAQVETSLEVLAKQRLLEAEEQAMAIVEEARAEAARILEKTNAQAREMVSIAQGEVDGVREAAHEAGFKAGFQEGYADATEQVETETLELAQSAKTLLEGAYQAEKRVLKEFEPHALALVEHVARRILNRELSDSPEALLTLIHQAIDNLYLSGKIKVVVSSQMIQELRQFSEKTLEAVDGLHRFEFEADPALALHQVYVISQEGSFDVSPDTQARQLLSPLEKHLELPRPEEDAADSIDSEPS